MKIHVGVVHKGEAHPYGCKLCNFIGKDSDNLKRHMLRKHPNSTPAKYECEYCGHTSVRRSELNNHLKMHTGEKSNKCNQCDYASSQTSTLRRHLTTHSGEKSNKCNQCDFASSQAGYLRRHLKTQWRKVKQM